MIIIRIEIILQFSEDNKIYKNYLASNMTEASDIEKLNTNFISYYKELKNVDLDEDLVKRKLIMKYNGKALFDTVSQKFKLEIEKKIKDSYKDYSNKQLFEELEQLKAEFNKKLK